MSTPPRRPIHVRKWMLGTTEPLVPSSALGVVTVPIGCHGVLPVADNPASIAAARRQSRIATHVLAEVAQKTTPDLLNVVFDKASPLQHAVVDRSRGAVRAMEPFIETERRAMQMNIDGHLPA